MLKTLKFKTKIEAPSSVVWTILWDPANYPKWTAPFGEGSHAVSDWKEGSSILFLGPGGGGLQSVIDKLEPNKLMRFRHIGAMKDGKPYEEESHKEWAGSIEQYELSEVDGRTILDVSVDSTETFIGFMSEK
ncbi:MAG TPA: SRPBCC domain-containing protein, partial [Flavitalea sp.]|nr:SRPBCC domain-containing protein [Flavitalea sp.]